MILATCPECGETYQPSLDPHVCKERPTGESREESGRVEVHDGRFLKDIDPADDPTPSEERATDVVGKLVGAAWDAAKFQAAAPDVCPTCGQRTRPMTNAERQRRFREGRS